MKKVLILILGLSLTAASCNLFGGGSGTRGVLRSEDGGETFNPANQIQPEGDISNLSLNTFTFDRFDPSVMYIGSASGLHKTDNGAESWRHILSNMRIGDVAVDPAQSDVIYASGMTGENGRIVKSVDGGESWFDVYTEPTKNNPVLAIAVGLLDSDIILAGLNGGEILRSTDGGVTWQVVRDLFNPVVEIEYGDFSKVYALTQNSGLYVSADQGSTWTALPISVSSPADSQNSYTSTRTYYDISIDPRSSQNLFVSSLQGLLRSSDQGANWSLATLPVANQTLPVSAAAVNPSDSSNIFIAVGSVIFESNNNGMTWETKQLPTRQRVRHIVINPDEPNLIYLGLTSQ